MPARKKGESAQNFMGRCMGSEAYKRKFPTQKQRVAV